MAQKVEQQLKELGSKLDSPPSSKDALLKLLKARILPLSFPSNLAFPFLILS
ncbi:sister chromatid cohesion protein, PDS5 B-like protein [Corchorus olitorius]|uniref:Sister chromatid cohesion protein, PDS5 B-like protein n=1 Tax=Corchorus olitorius TaxID=93759 RepID=A0A1R3H2Z1_9ROSI|nr:sister chromatid cohesion protein, PDS5 B-like protein [Corchorus olitorius]